MELKLHQYQQECVDTLREFLQEAAKISPKHAFIKMTDRPYFPAHNMPEQMPFVCLRIPTGGGKTLLAAHAAVVAAKTYAQTDLPVFLWVAPSDAIVSQTLKSLRTRGHPCREVLTKAFNNVHCISISEALRVNKHDMDGGATVIVTTWQSFHVEKTKTRKVYDENGNLMEHFDRVPEALRDKIRGDNGEISYSLANALKLRCPIIIEDEAHNARGKQFYESLTRFNPSCFIEFTATPQIKHNPKKNIYGSNVLFRAAARELKEAGMIKMPINLKTFNNWRESMRTAVTKREELEKFAMKLRAESGEYIRPIVLYQAENKGVKGGANVEVIRDVLVNHFGIPQEQIAIYTSDKKELKNIDLLSDKISLRHIITVKALAEGWDCSFAYILCTMANLQSGRPVEQVLGRILRLPRATPKSIAELNESYAYSSGGDFYNVAHALKDALVQGAGFQNMEAADLIAGRPNESEPLFKSIPVANTGLAKNIKPLFVPFLAVQESGKLKFLEPMHCLEDKWSIAKEKPDMSDFEPPMVVSGQGMLDVDKSGVKIKYNDSAIGIREQMMLLEADKKWTIESLAAWIDKSILHRDIPQIQSSPYIVAAVRQLLDKYELPVLVRYRSYIKTTIEDAIDKLRQKEYKKGYQRMLGNISGDGRKLAVSTQCALTFTHAQYKARSICDNVTSFGKHLFPEVGELDNKGEEWECAKHIDGIEEVEIWVRNLTKRGFGLPTSKNIFYPDFVCRLKDGRILVVEYKGEQLAGSERTMETESVGKVWAQLSGGTCLFVMSKNRDWQAINNCIAGKAGGD